MLRKKTRPRYNSVFLSFDVLPYNIRHLRHVFLLWKNATVLVRKYLWLVNDIMFYYLKKVSVWTIIALWEIVIFRKYFKNHKNKLYRYTLYIYNVLLKYTSIYYTVDYITMFPSVLFYHISSCFINILKKPLINLNFLFEFSFNSWANWFYFVRWMIFINKNLALNLLLS